MRSLSEVAFLIDANKTGMGRVGNFHSVFTCHEFMGFTIRHRKADSISYRSPERPPSEKVKE